MRIYLKSIDLDLAIVVALLNPKIMHTLFPELLFIAIKIVTMPVDTAIEKEEILVIGGGAAGMIAAWRAATLGANVILLEKNAKLGIKLLISGGGKCNITHGGEMETLRQQFKVNEGRFLKHAFFEFTNAEIIRFLNELGVETYERDDGRIFPKSGKAGDVVHALRRLMEGAGVEIRLSAAVEEILKDDDGVSGVRTSQEILPSRHIILATGGSSYPRTGTTGDGFGWARKLGHSIVPLRPALAPILLSPTPPKEWQGVALRNCILKASTEEAVVAQWQGDLLFTHEGISGPAVLEISRETFESMEGGQKVFIQVDISSQLAESELEKNIQQEIVANGSRNVETLAALFLPHRLAPFLLNACRIDGTKKCHQMTKDERRTLVQTLKNWPIGCAKEIQIERGEVTSGGVELKEIDPKTMHSRVVKGLYVCGEVLDISGPVGGYNLQAAFSTGYVAGEAAALNLKNSPSSSPSSS